jgi:hypothetical protein
MREVSDAFLLNVAEVSATLIGLFLVGVFFYVETPNWNRVLFLVLSLMLLAANVDRAKTSRGRFSCPSARDSSASAPSCCRRFDTAKYGAAARASLRDSPASTEPVGARDLAATSGGAAPSDKSPRQPRTSRLAGLWMWTGR